MIARAILWLCLAASSGYAQTQVRPDQIRNTSQVSLRVLYLQNQTDLTSSPWIAFGPPGTQTRVSGSQLNLVPVLTPDGTLGAIFTAAITNRLGCDAAWCSHQPAEPLLYWPNDPTQPPPDSTFGNCWHITQLWRGSWFPTDYWACDW